MKVLIDTNVLISAFIAHGICSDVTGYCVAEHQICSCDFILTELEKKLQTKFKLGKRESKLVSDYIRRISLIANYGVNFIPKICRDKQDNHILAAAAAEVLKVDCIVSGAPDLTELKNYAGIPILSPREFWKLRDKIF